MYRSRDDFVYLLIIWNFVFLIIDVFLSFDKLLNFRPSFLIAWFLVEHSGLNNKIVQKFLQRGSVEDFLFDWGVRYEPEDPDLVFLAYSVGPVLRLLIHHGIPIGVENYDGIGRLGVLKRKLPVSLFLNHQHGYLVKTRRILSFPRWISWSFFLFLHLLCGLHL